MLRERDFIFNDSEVTLDGLGLHRDGHSEWAPLIVVHPHLLSVTPYRGKLVLERLIMEMNLLSHDLVHWILEQEMEGKPLLQWLVEDRRLYPLFHHHRVIMSGFRVRSYSGLLDCFWLKFQPYSGMNGVFGVKK